MGKCFYWYIISNRQHGVGFSKGIGDESVKVTSMVRGWIDKRRGQRDYWIYFVYRVIVSRRRMWAGILIGEYI